MKCFNGYATFEDYIENLLKKKAQENFDRVRKSVDPTSKDHADTLYKINEHCNLFSMQGREKEILQSILDNDIIATKFAISPTRQSPYEKNTRICLKRKKLVIKKLPQSGTSALYLNSNGEVQNGFRPKPKKSNGISYTKSFDAQDITDSTKTVYLYIKYTKGGGGAQDNQEKDGTDFLQYGYQHHKNNPKSNIIFVGIYDGTYYTKEVRKQLKENFFIPGKVIVSSTTEYNGIE